MLPNILLNFTEYFQPLNIFNYISFRTIGALLTALLISFIFGEKIIFLLNSVEICIFLIYLSSQLLFIHYII